MKYYRKKSEITSSNQCLTLHSNFGYRTLVNRTQYTDSNTYSYNLWFK